MAESIDHGLKESSFREESPGVWKSDMPGLVYIERSPHTDERGFFKEVCRIPQIEGFVGTDFRPLQWNHTFSLPGVIRGIHAEGWNKLVYVASGTALCQWVDLRTESATFLTTANLTIANGEGVAFIPMGVGNSFGVIGDTPVHYFYLVDRTYDLRDRSWDNLALNPFDPAVDFHWPIEDPILSERDTSRALSLQQLLRQMRERRMFV